MNKAIFLDRDGIINLERKDYVKTIKEFILIDEIFDIIKLINSKGYLVIIITNQSAINRKIITESNLREIHNHFLKLAKNKNAKVDGIYFCPHTPNENCKCRKPKPELIKQAALDFQVDLSQSWMIGDNQTDFDAGINAGCKAIKISNAFELENCLDKIFLKH